MELVQSFRYAIALTLTLSLFTINIATAVPLARLIDLLEDRSSSPYTKSPIRETLPASPEGYTSEAEKADRDYLASILSDYLQEKSDYHTNRLRNDRNYLLRPYYPKRSNYKLMQGFGR